MLDAGIYLAPSAFEAGFVSAAHAPDDIATHVGWRTSRALALARLGRTDEADATAQQAVRMAEQTDSTELRVGALLAIAEVRKGAGRANEATPFLRKVIRLCERRGAEAQASRARRLLAETGDGRRTA